MKWAFDKICVFVSDIPAATAEDVELAVGAARKALTRGSIWVSSSRAYRAKFLCAIAVKGQRMRVTVAQLFLVKGGEEVTRKVERW
ncbi:hypothetical protein Drorol1_Dr00025260 [Drosera rotundifolia]